jgi:ribosomal protein S18 acetylase RimI-like enzyme
MSGRLVYFATESPKPEEVRDLYAAAGLTRPTDDLKRLRRMMEGSNILLTCFEESPSSSRLVGLLRGWTDYAFNGYICDLAVHPDHQHRGIGKELLDRALTLGAPEVMWILRAVPGAMDFYAHLGWQKVEDGWMRPRGA